MSGSFELISGGLGELRVRLLADDGQVLAVSLPYADMAAAVAGIAAVREIAGTGLIVDHTEVTRPPAAPVSRACDGSAPRPATRNAAKNIQPSRVHA